MSRSFTTFLCCAAMIVAAASSPAGAGDGSRPRSEVDLSWLEGDWRGTTSEGEFSQEVWTAVAGGELMGMWRWVSGDTVRLYEFFTIALGEVPVLRLRHFSPAREPWESERDGPLTLRLVDSASNQATFSGLEGGKVVRLTYRRLSEDELEAVLEEEGGRNAFRYRRHR